MSVTDATPEQITAGLLALVECGGNSEKAHEKCGTPSSTLRKWRKEHAEQYRTIEARYADELEDATKARAQEIAFQAGDLEVELLQKVKDKMGSMDGREAAQAARAVADVKAKSIDKWMALSGRNPDGARRETDLWAEIMGGVRSGVLKLTAGVEPIDADGQDESEAGRRPGMDRTAAPTPPETDSEDDGENPPR